MSERSVYVGAWTNWSQGQVLGATITVPAKYGTLLIAFLAIFVAWTGNQLWNIICYILHQLHSTPDVRDAIHHQQQVLLRAGLSDIAFLWRLIKIPWSWKSGPPQQFRQSILMALLAIFHAACIAVAGIFSSRVTSANSEVLVGSTTCGLPSLAPLHLIALKPEELAQANALSVLSETVYERGRKYARSCYPSRSKADDSTCSMFTQQWLEASVNRSDACPFQDICDTAAITLDSGLIDSDFHLGINAAPSDRIQLRKVLSCASVPVEQLYSSNWTTDSPPPIFPWDPDSGGPGVSFKYYYLGPQVYYGLFKRNFTFVEANYSGSWRKAYTSFIQTSFIGDEPSSNFEPIPVFNLIDADVSIWCLRNRAIYTDQVNDPWFRATSLYTTVPSRLWKADDTISAIGCTEQYSFCNTHSNCTKLNGLFKTRDVATQLGYNKMQKAVFDLLWNAMFATRLLYATFVLEDNMLLARDQVFGSYRVSTSLPDNQWQLEVQNAYNISLAVLQDFPTLHASPPQIQITPNSTYDQYIIPNNATTEGIHLCQNQKIRSSTYYSFSVVGLAIIILGGSLIILLSNLIPVIVALLLKRRAQQGKTRCWKKQEEWEMNDVLQLQRIALERYGVRPWKVDGEVPTLTEDLREFKVPWLEENNLGAESETTKTPPGASNNR